MRLFARRPLACTLLLLSCGLLHLETKNPRSSHPLSLPPPLPFSPLSFAPQAPDQTNNASARASSQFLAPMLWTDLADSPDSPQRITGFAFVTFSWDTVFSSAVPSFVERLDVVLSSPRASFTMRVDRGAVENVGWGDLHSGTLDRYKRTTTIKAGNTFRVDVRSRAAPRRTESQQHAYAALLRSLSRCCVASPHNPLPAPPPRPSSLLRSTPPRSSTIRS